MNSGYLCQVSGADARCRGQAAATQGPGMMSAKRYLFAVNTVRAISGEIWVFKFQDTNHKMIIEGSR